jgi:glycosyltransferase involved in cell wall biosynthesis
MDLPPNYKLEDFRDIYGRFNVPGELSPGAVEKIDGFTLHVLPHTKVLGYMRMSGLFAKLRLLRPEIVQTSTNISWLGLDAALGKLLYRYHLFTGCHYHASVFPLSRSDAPIWNPARMACFLTRTIPGAFTSLLTEKCYAIAEDCADVAVRFFGVPRSKAELCPLGVDTELYHPVRTASESECASKLRRDLGFADEEIVCIYTGRFSEDKNPLLLARAIERLRSAGAPFRGLFVGQGPQSEEIQACLGPAVHPFIPVQDLGNYFRAADIGVWPTQESLSMLDAAACGLPIVANHTMAAPERLSGNGRTFRLNDLDDLTRALMGLRDPQVRAALGDVGARKMALEYSWDAIAKRRISDYESALHSPGGQPRLAGQTS